MKLSWMLRRALQLAALGSVGVMLAAGARWLEVDGIGGALATIPNDPLLGVTELVRHAALAAAVWLFAVTLLDTIGSVAQIAPLRRVAARLAPAFWRNAVLRPGATLAIALPPVLLPVASISPVAAHQVVIETPEPDDVAADGRTLTMTAGRLDARPAQPRLTMTRDLVRSHEPPTAPVEVGPPIADDAAAEAVHEATHQTTTHMVVSGDNLWSIAAARLTEAHGHRPSTREITPYWRAVIEANRDRLPDRLNPDLLFPGVQLVLPPVD